MTDQPNNHPLQSKSTSKLRKYFRFNLRFLLIFVTAICVCFGFLLQRAERQKKGVEFVIESGGSVRYDYQVDAVGNFDLLAQSRVSQRLLDVLGHDFFHSVVEVNMEKESASLPDLFSHGMEALFSPFTSHFSKDEPFRDLCKSLPKVRKLTLDRRHGTDNNLEYVGALSRLEALSVRNSKYITDEGIEHLRHARKLQTIYLLGTSQITDNSLETLGRLPNLRRINVQSGSISDTGISHLKNCEHLTKAYFMPPHQSSFSRSSAPLEFTDDALRTLGSLSNLEVVGISSSQFTNDGVVHLAKLKQLHTLILRGPDKQRNAIDDHGLLLLLDNKLLSDVDVTNTRVTNFAAAKLTNQLPGCRITHGFQ